MDYDDDTLDTWPDDVDETVAVPTRLFDRQDWVKDAQCHGLTTLFFSTAHADQARAKAICATCSVIEPCGEAGRNNGDRGGGVWGGEVNADRRYKRQRAAGIAPAINHGTNSGYQMHYRLRDLPVCEPCRRAHVEVQQAARAAKRERLARAAEFRNNGGHGLDWCEDGAA